MNGSGTEDERSAAVAHASLLPDYWEVYASNDTTWASRGADEKKMK
jgi:hypothetical protein